MFVAQLGGLHAGLASLEEADDLRCYESFPNLLAIVYVAIINSLDTLIVNGFLLFRLSRCVLVDYF